MAKNKKVAVIGDLFADHFTRIMQYPAEGESTQGTPFERISGGCGGNIAAGMSVLGVDTYFFVRLGDDDVGRFLMDDLVKSGVHVDGIVLDKENASGITMIAIAPSGERSIWVLAKGSAYEKMVPEDLNYLEEIDPEIIFVSGVLLGTHPTEETILSEIPKWKGRATIYFDPNLRYPPDAVPEALKKAMQQVSDISDVVFAGDVEMRALGLTPQKGQIFIEKFGKDGSSLIDPEGRTLIHVEATDHQATDTTGAGDAYAAAFLAAQLDGRSIEESMRFAAAASGIVVTRFGARTMPTKAEVEEYLQNGLC